jgi:hypothetical protein
MMDKNACTYRNNDRCLPDLLLTILAQVAALRDMGTDELEEPLWQNWRAFTRDIGAWP